ncbi:NADH:flavin oxidoreductase [Clostridium chromiireducens]|uniref:NADH:flavin oxidoreductase n=1 Tax=Clostridium chromiireducens TaxID=225345 RepID=A0A399IM03_9CLOT|nr:NADH:flavin oxidoreductase [Clostridium chromiireducens]RII34045.1 NADH:flavin oxidoreductase [Clostridium chromiireducens]
MEKNLFEKTKIGNMNMKNRFIAAAVTSFHAINGHMTEKDFKVYEDLAKGGSSTIITGYTYISHYAVSDGMLGIYDDSFIQEYKELTDVVHQQDANIILQLVHPGSVTLVNTHVARILGPSEVENLLSKKVPFEMTKEDIKKVQHSFADAALRAQKAGFDGIELHAAHGLLLSQFLTPYYNQRTDEYGGSDENRARMLVETIQCIREKVGLEYPIFVKINCSDNIENGITSEGFHTACKQIISSGVSAIEVSGPWMIFKNTDSFYFLDHTKKIAEEKEIPIILVGGINDIATANKIINDTSIEYLSLARPLIAEPDLINRLASGDTSKMKCIRCNGCAQNSGQCVLNQ